MTAAEIAAETGLSASNVRRMVQRGELPRLRGTARVIVPTIAVERWIAESINGNGPQQFAPAGGPAQTTEGTRDAEQPRP
jgi:predicted DNA-binding transcriptional regulator AlpA